MNNEKIQTGGGEFNTGLDEVEKRQRDRRFGRKVLDILKNVFSKKEEEYYYLAKEAPIPKEGTRANRKWLKNDVYGYSDEKGARVPMELARMIEKNVNDKNNWFGIHHPGDLAVDGTDYIDSPDLRDIMKEGLTIMGDASSGSIYEDPPVDKTARYCADMPHAIMELRNRWKGSANSVLVNIPREYLKDDAGHVKEDMFDKVYTKNAMGNAVLRPEFILGFVKNAGTSEDVCEFIPRDKLLEMFDKNEA